MSVRFHFHNEPINTSRSVLEKITEHSLISEINYCSYLIRDYDWLSFVFEASEGTIQKLSLRRNWSGI